MQIVLHVGSNVFNNSALSKVLDKLGKRIINHKTYLAQISSIWDNKSTEENLIRNSNQWHQIFISYLIISKVKNFLSISSFGLSASTVEIRDDEAIVLCTGSLITWKNVILHLLSNDTTNELGELVLQALENLGYGGVFYEYNRKRVGENLKLEYKPC